MIKVGTNSFGYNHLRNFVGLPFNDVSFKKLYDIYKLPAHFHYKFRNKVIPGYINRFNDFGLNNVDLYHFFNSLTPVKRPWIVTFETTLPRLDPGFVKGYKWMASKYCKKIIAYTQRATNAQLYQLNLYPEFRDAIIDKMILLYPSQRVIVDNISKKDFEGNIIFTIVGNAFFLKGGWELVMAFEKFKKENLPVRLNIISKLEIHGYKDEHVELKDVDSIRKIISNNHLINLHEGLPNTEVISILSKSHIGILPSYGETFGYSLLEAMGCGCAVVSTSISPFPEFVQDEWGWTIPVPTKLVNGLEMSDTKGGFNSEFSNTLKEGIYNIVHKILLDRELLAQKCQNAIKRIIEHHNPLDRANTLSTIYSNALDKN